MIKTAVILAGGRGQRLMPITAEKPKAMVDVLKRPLIEWIILWLKKNGVREIILSVDYKKEALQKHLGNGKNMGIKITYNDHSGAKETGDAFRSVLTNIKLPEQFLAMNGDQITDLPLKDFVRHHERYNPIATMVACPLRLPYGIVELKENHIAHRFLEKPVVPNMLMNAGIYIFNKAILKHLTKNGAIEKTTFKRLAEEKKLGAYVYNGLFTTVNDAKDLKESEKILKNSKLNFI